MNKKSVFLGIFFWVVFLAFLWSFFGLITFHRIIAGFFLFVGIMFWSLTGGPKTLWFSHRRQIVIGALYLTLCVGVLRNRFTALSFILFVWWIVFTFWDLDHYQHKVLRYNSRTYCIFGWFAMIYFMWFATAANIIGNNTNLSFECDDIYSNYAYLTQRFTDDKADENKSIVSRAKRSRSEQLRMDFRELLFDKPWLQALYNKLKLYKQDISSTIVDQKQINKEICMLVTARIHEIYDSSNIKIGLVLLIWLFLYPFFIILIYIYGFLTLLLFRIAIYAGLFKFTEEQVTKKWIE